MISIFNPSGERIYQAQICFDKEIELPKGIYIVKIGIDSKKIIVK
ncbi:MAG: T9SS type A sorting domain-containing protein [Dysgonamonadaceae bacterium]|nr:T9SS type A sorting domain-containing protein [Dysgonamonadaceae bacterium]